MVLIKKIVFFGAKIVFWQKKIVFWQKKIVFWGLGERSYFFVVAKDRIFWGKDRILAKDRIFLSWQKIAFFCRGKKSRSQGGYMQFVHQA